jgi:hypothetical protein
MNYEHSNDTFERLLIDACKQHLKPSISEYAYSTVVLNELWNGEKYSDHDNEDYYHEIKGQYTIDGVPVIVRIP